MDCSLLGIVVVSCNMVHVFIQFFQLHCGLLHYSLITLHHYIIITLAAVRPSLLQ